jgi:hypothetical protein
MEDSEIIKSFESDSGAGAADSWRPVRIAPPDGEVHFLGDVKGPPSERRTRLNGKMAEARPCANYTNCLCGGRNFELRYDGFIPIVGTDVVITCEHQILAD